MERPSSEPRPRIWRAPGSLENSPLDAHFAVNMCRLRIRDPAFARGTRLFATSNWCMQGQSEPFSAARGPIRAWPPETAHDRPSPGYRGNFEDMRATFSSTGLLAFPRAISGKTQPC